ncbi:hypothetical protein HAZT_HAZT004255 [Hyalella azteca]|uniref:Uncharacterized protein n=1 Tax=Hyalella azteca TaxID=294128 RepID=A0A6A0GSD3_HYAAZ|nr:hypothetical protein HAZT_HAZT004255 [Hyalella azteca]
MSLAGCIEAQRIECELLQSIHAQNYHCAKDSTTLPWMPNLSARSDIWKRGAKLAPQISNMDDEPPAYHEDIEPIANDIIDDYRQSMGSWDMGFMQGSFQIAWALTMHSEQQQMGLGFSQMQHQDFTGGHHVHKVMPFDQLNLDELK